jgi:hypothetical protein
MTSRAARREGTASDRESDYEPEHGLVDGSRGRVSWSLQQSIQHDGSWRIYRNVTVVAT